MELLPHSLLPISYSPHSLLPIPDSPFPIPDLTMRILGQPAIVLHATRWRESSLLLELLTHEHGRVGAIARGVHGPKKQPLRAALQPLQRIRVDYLHRGELAHLMTAEASGHSPALYQRARRYRGTSFSVFRDR